MEWWGWLIVALVLVAVLATAVFAVQARRRRGGVIVAPSPRDDGGRR